MSDAKDEYNSIDDSEGMQGKTVNLGRNDSRMVSLGDENAN